MKVSAARMAALEVVTRVREREAYAHETLDAVLHERDLDERDSALATRLAYGTIATRGTLDEALLRYVGNQKRLEPRVSDALAVSAYQLVFMRVPAHAAVSEGVEMVRTQRAAAAGLANAVLRRLAGDVSEFPWGDPATDIAARARLHGHPAWIARLLDAELGRERAEQVMAANNEPAPLFLAHIAARRPLSEVVDSLEKVGAGPTPCELPGCLVVRDASAALQSSAVLERDVLVMDAGAQFAVHAAAITPGGTLIEIGAGRGSKTLLAASLVESQGQTARIVAVDLHSFKLDALKTAADDMGLSGIEVAVADAASDSFSLPIGDGQVEGVLIDAPCSGLGTLRRHPDRRWRAEPSEIEALAGLGIRLLERSSRLVRPGGFVVYSTCTIVRRENEDVVERFLASEAGQGFVPDSLEALVPAGWERYLLPEGWFRSLPEMGGPDGHFVARLRRQ